MKKLHEFFNTYYPGSPSTVTQFKREGNDFVYRAPLTGNQFILKPVGGRKKNEFECERLSSRGNRIPSKLHDWEKNPKLRLEIITGITKDPNLKTWKSLETFFAHEHRVKKVYELTLPMYTKVHLHEFAFSFPDKWLESIPRLLTSGKMNDFDIRTLHFPGDEGVVVFEMNHAFHMDSLPSLYDKIVRLCKAAS